MATVVPPPSKRQRVAAAEKAKKQQDIPSNPDDVESLRFQLYDKLTGKELTVAPISIPVAQATRVNLQALVNHLKGHDESESFEYEFDVRRSLASGSSKEAQPSRISTDALKPFLKSDILSVEGAGKAEFSQLSVFRVKAVTRCSSSIPGHGEAILTMQFSSLSSSRMVSGSGDNTARIWDCDTGTPLHTLKGHTGWVQVVSWSPDNETIATGAMDNTVRLWDPKTGKPQGSPLNGHRKPVTSLAWEPYHLQTPGRPRLASASLDHTVRIWDTVSKRIDQVLSGHADGVQCVKWGGYGQIYTASRDKTVKIWDSTTGILLKNLTGHTHWVNYIALSTEFALRTAYNDHKHNPPVTQQERIDKAKSQFETAANAYGAPAERIASASDDCTLYLWSSSAATASSPKLIGRLLGHQKVVIHSCFSPNGKFIASSAFDNHVKLWDASDGKFLFTLRGHVGFVSMSCFSPDSRWLVSSSKDSTLKIWDTSSGQMKEDLIGHQDLVTRVDWALDGELVASGGLDKKVRLWRH